jgi:hypothetical protein
VGGGARWAPLAHGLRRETEENGKGRGKIGMEGSGKGGRQERERGIGRRGR